MRFDANRVMRTMSLTDALWLGIPNEDIARMLTSDGSGFEVKDYRGRTARDWAERKKRLTAARFLGERGSRLAAADKNDVRTARR